MLGLKKLCCCIVSDPQTLDISEQDVKNSSTSDTIMTLSKKKPAAKLEENSILTLVVVETMSMQLGSEYTINKHGLKGSRRKVQDSCVYAGNLESQGNLVINDILLPADEKGTGKRHFMIKFNPEKQRFFLKDMGEGLGTFVRIDRPLKLKNSFIVSFGDSHMIISLDNSFITLRFIQGPKTDHKSYFTVRTFSPEDSPVKIGRMNDCDIKFEDSSLSRYHCFMFFEDCWMISDGDGRKFSTNGTWLFAEQFFEVFDGLVFKAGETLFQARTTVEKLNSSAL